MPRHRCERGVAKTERDTILALLCLRIENRRVERHRVAEIVRHVEPARVPILGLPPRSVLRHHREKAADRDARRHLDIDDVSDVAVDIVATPVGGEWLMGLDDANGLAVGELEDVATTSAEGETASEEHVPLRSHLDIVLPVAAWNVEEVIGVVGGAGA